MSKAKRERSSNTVLGKEEQGERKNSGRQKKDSVSPLRDNLDKKFAKPESTKKKENKK